MKSFFNNLHNLWENSAILVWINERMQIYNTNTIPKNKFLQPNISDFNDHQTNNKNKPNLYKIQAIAIAKNLLGFS